MNPALYAATASTAANTATNTGNSTGNVTGTGSGVEVDPAIALFVIALVMVVSVTVFFLIPKVSDIMYRRRKKKIENR